MPAPRTLIGVAVIGVSLTLGAPAVAAPEPVAAASVVSPQNGASYGGTIVRLVGNRPPEPLRFTQLALGSSHSVGIAPDGTAYAWGSNTYGTLGNGTRTDSLTPVRVSMPAGVEVRQVDAGSFHSLALGSDSRVYAWGSGADGALGTGGGATSTLPVPVVLPDGVVPVQVAAQAYHSMVLGSDGALYVFGGNQDGQLGTGDSAPRLTPERVAAPDGSRFVQVDTEYGNTAALTDAGNVFVWGSNTFYQLGRDGSGTSSPEPLHTPPPVTFTQVSVGGGGFMLALGSDGNLWGWGVNSSNVLAADTDLAQVPWEVKAVLPPGVTFTEIEAGGGFALALDTEDRLWGWGSNYTGALGFDDDASHAAPELLPVPGGAAVTSMDASHASTLVTTSDGSGYGWGWSSYGQLGNGSTAPESLPSPILPPPLVPVSASFGGVEAYALDVDGQTLRAYTRPHPVGVVDVELTWSDGLVEVLPAAYTFGSAPTVTQQPESIVLDADDGDDADDADAAAAAAGRVSDADDAPDAPDADDQLFAYATGDPSPTVQWQRLADDGRWVDVPGGTSEALTVEEVGRYRAVFTNGLGTAISDVAVVSKLGAPPAPGTEPTPAADEKPTATGLAQTGVDLPVGMLGLSGALLAIGLGILLWTRRRRVGASA